IRCVGSWPGIGVGGGVDIRCVGICGWPPVGNGPLGGPVDIGPLGGPVSRCVANRSVGGGGGGSRGTGVVAADRAASANWIVVRYRSSGFLAIPLLITSSNVRGTWRRSTDGRGGGVCKCAVICCSKLSPGNGLSPVKHSCSTHAKAYTSTRAS